MCPSEYYDLALALDWEYDWDFIRIVEKEAEGKGLSVFTISPANVDGTLKELRAGNLEFGMLVDRASGSSPDFLAVHTLIRQRGWDILEPVEKLRWASDKATMHLEFISRGLYTPHSLILPSFESQPVLELRAEELEPLGSPFVIKPANTTGGSLGVIEDASGIDDVLAARQTYPADKYLLQEKIFPEERDGVRFWFRGFYILGDVWCTWWDDRTHLYRDLTDHDRAFFSLDPLSQIVRNIAAVSGLRFFSTEIVRDVRGRFLVVDYVNEICDMRLQSRHSDGVPDTVVRNIASRIVSFAESQVSSKGTVPRRLE